jgi:hypothetical protein
MCSKTACTVLAPARACEEAQAKACELRATGFLMGDPSRGDRSTIAVLSIQAVVVTVNGVAVRGRSLAKVRIIQIVYR